ncbi:MAG: SDR family NAD(P)-dependent oxidoreductase [Pseudomonadales bacterium]|nr:SDR family NAD(P)-dependent oxidoreductase [Pseudomonadales bacterium]MBO6564873.1 SDR family NAD(P)-dependent oxidoreductase [Pseudomonadales bacterium]MBO6596801.1 SDR family NAD(P)-dependent oxidoreductase [Pseudomonadales bacterium]MBO6823210.1 SDR family NAD(P)-dependent oxidoreductase [Pseudomonadales bacterium]
MKALNGKVAVVTGAASGIGKATATRFAEEGMKVVLSDIEEAALEKAVQELSDRNFEVIGVPTDVSRNEAIESLAEQTMSEFGSVNVVHNNAGVVVSGPIEALSLSDWEWVLGVDLWSVIYGVRTFLPLIKESGDGHIINTASTAGLQASGSIAPYNVAKFGVVALTETLRVELDEAKCGVSASVLCPGAINTQIVMSKRNRDPDSAKDHQSSPQEEAFEKNAGALLAQQGKDPAEVAGMIVNAILNDEFWILTHDEWKKVLRDRVDAIARDNSLYRGFGG